MSLTIPRKAVITLFCIISFLFAAGSLQADEKTGIQTEGDSYIIGKGDTLEVVVWKEEELSREVKVRVDGRISLPLVDDVMAAGRTPMELKKEVDESLSKFIEGPE
ncbi:MAG: polysaccharide biosynthesis/export family protein, partial [Desulfobia sp.]